MEALLRAIKEEMSNRGMNVSQLATLAGHPPAFSNPVSASSSIGRILSGETERPSFQAIAQICEVLQISLSVGQIDAIAAEDPGGYDVDLAKGGPWMRVKDGQVLPLERTDLDTERTGTILLVQDRTGRRFELKILGHKGGRVQTEYGPYLEKTGGGGKR